MKHFKILSLLIVVVAFITSCNNENNFYEEQTSTDQMSGKGLLNARTDISESLSGNLFALKTWEIEYGSGEYRNNIQSFDFDPLTGDFLENNFESSTGFEVNYSFDYNKLDGLVYFLADPNEDDYSDSDSEYERALFTLNMETNEIIELATIVSFNGDVKPINITFGNDETLYIIFKGGEINTYNIASNTMAEFSDVSDLPGENKTVGLTYDHDYDRLLYSRSENYYSDGAFIYGIDIATGTPSYIDEFYATQGESSFNAASIEYVGNNKIISGTMWGDSSDDTAYIYLSDLSTGISESVYSFQSGDEYPSRIRDFMFINNPDIDNDGVLNEDDLFPASNKDEMLSIGGYGFDIENQFSDEGITMMDQIDALIAEINEQYDGSNGDALHRMFTRELSKITYYWYKSRFISRRERTQISRVASAMSIPFYNQEF